MMLQSNTTVQTVSGRAIVAPAIDTTTERKTINTLRRVDEWLAREALQEAKATRQDWVAQLIEGMNPKRLSPADRDQLNLVLFGEV